jgi:Ubiquitin carboxyl-terminal hydrolase
MALQNLNGIDNRMPARTAHSFNVPCYQCCTSTLAESPHTIHNCAATAATNAATDAAAAIILSLSLQVDPVLNIPCADGSSVEYVLHAVLHHRGTLSTSGHYVAEVLDPASERWFMCDDESVTDTKARTAAGSSGSTAAGAAASDDWADGSGVFEYEVVSHCYA